MKVQAVSKPIGMQKCISFLVCAGEDVHHAQLHVGLKYPLHLQRHKSDRGEVSIPLFRTDTHMQKNEK